MSETLDQHIVHFRFRLQQEVRIIALKLPGKVIGRAEKWGSAPSYYVVFWSDGRRYDDWLFEFELTEATEK